MDENVINFIKSKDLILINIHEIMKNSGNYKKFFPFDGKRFGHFNEAGYELVSKEIEKYLINKQSYLIAKKPSKQTNLKIDIVSLNPALFNISKFAFDEKGSRTPFKLLDF